MSFEPVALSGRPKSREALRYSVVQGGGGGGGRYLVMYLAVALTDRLLSGTTSVRLDLGTGKDAGKALLRGFLQADTGCRPIKTGSKGGSAARRVDWKYADVAQWLPDQGQVVPLDVLEVTKDGILFALPQTKGAKS